MSLRRWRERTLIRNADGLLTSLDYLLVNQTLAGADLKLTFTIIHLIPEESGSC